MAQPRDARGRFTKASGQSLGEAVGRFRIDTSGISGADRVVSAAATSMAAAGNRINTSIKGIADGFGRAKSAADAFNKSPLGQIQKGLDDARKSAQLLSLAAAGIVTAGVAAASNINSVNARFTIFLGSATKAKQELDNIRKIADATGQSFTELASTGADLLSVAKNYKVEVGGLLTIAQQLKAVDPTARSLDTSRAIREFLSGNNKTLNAVFELDKEGLDKISEGATDAADRLQRLSKYLADLGFGNDILKGLADQGIFTFDSLKGEIEEALGTAFMPFLKDFLLPGAKAVGAFVRQLRETNPELLKLAAAGTIIVAGLAPVLLILSQLISAYKNLKTVSAFSGGGLGKAAGVGLAVGAGVGLGVAGANVLANSTNLQTGDLNRIRAGEKAEDILGERLKQGFVILIALIIKGIQVVADVLSTGANLVKQSFELIGAALTLGGSYLQEGFGNIQKSFGSALISLSALISRIPGQSAAADAIGNAGLSAFSSGSDAVNNALFSRQGAQERLGRGLDLKETQAVLDSTNQKFEDLQNGIVGALNAFLFPAQKVEEAGDGAADALKKVENAANPLATKIIAAKDDIIELAKDISKQRSDFNREQKQLDDERKIAAGREQFDFDLGRSRSAADRTRDNARELADLARTRGKQIAAAINADNQTEAEGQKRRQEIIAKGQDEIAQLAIEQGERLEEIQKRTTVNVANAAAKLDANAVFEAQAAGGLELDKATKGFDTETKKKQEALDQQIADLDKANGELRNQRLNALYQQFADEDAERAIQNTRKEEDRLLQQKREDDDRTLRLQRQQEDYTRQDTLRRDALNRNINDQIAALSATTGINQRMLSTVVNGLAAAGGQVANFVDFVNKTVARLGVSANGNVPATSGTGRPTTRLTPTFAGGGNPPLNRVFQANEVGMESALIDGKYFAMLSQPATIFSAQQTQRLLGGAGGGGVFAPNIDYHPVFNDVGSFTAAELEGISRRSMLQAIQQAAALQGGEG